MMTAIDKDQLKAAAAEAASHLVEDGMVVGLGTGTTAAFLVSSLGKRVRDGLRIVAMPTSEATRAHAIAEGIAVVGFADHTRIDLTIDGADEVATGSLDLIKGAGGALLREKIVASASDRMVVIADGSKLVDRLGEGCRLPVEIVPFGWEATMRRLRDRSRDVRLRRDGQGAPFVTDGGHYIADCDVGKLGTPAKFESDLNAIVGVIETGLFVGIATEAFIADASGVRRLVPAGP
jgi:ribose 5-phosphate isomerase A